MSSFKARYLSKLASNLITMVIGVVVMLLVPGSLGPELYGKFEFVVVNFKAMLAVVTLSLPNSYFVWVSRKMHETDLSGITGRHFLIFLSVFLCLSIFISLGSYLNVNQIIWPEIPIWLIYAGLIFSFSFFLVEFLSNLYDGIGLTLMAEKTKAVHKLMRGLFVFLLFQMGLLTIGRYALLEIMLFVLAIFALVRYLVKNRVLDNRTIFPLKSKKRDWLQYKRFAIAYTTPLIVLSVFSFFQEYFDRWFLQWVDGSIAQGYFSLSFRLSSIAIIFTSAATPILIKEFSFSYEVKDFDEMVKHYDKIKIFYFISVVCSMFLMINIDQIIHLIGQEDFTDARLPMLIMSLYPIHQTLGQLNGSFLLSNNKTRLYSLISVLGFLAGLPLTYFLLAPETYRIPGLGMGSTGLAIKFVLLQLLLTNLQVYFNVRFLKGSWTLWFWYQIKFLLIGLILAGLVYIEFELILTWINQLNNQLLRTPISVVFARGLAYAAHLVLLIYVMPSIIGLSRSELSSFAQKWIRSK